MTTAIQNEPTTATQVEDTLSNEAGKYLTFKLAKGVINLRGKVIPVIDLRLKFGLEEIEHTEQTCIIVVNVGKEIGIITDTVCEVLDIAGENIEPPPSMGGAVETSFILGMGKVGDAVKILLDINRVLTAEEMIDMDTSLSANSGEPSAEAETF